MPPYFCVMKYQVGDRILVMHTNEEGEVIDIINDKMVLIEVKGVRFPAYMDQIDFPYFKRFTEKKAPPPPQKKYIDSVKREPVPAKDHTVDGVWLSFLPVTDLDEFGDEVVELFKIYLLNHTAEAYNFHYHLNFQGRSEFDLKNELLPFNDFYIHDVPFKDFSDSPKFDFEFSQKSPVKGRAAYFETGYKIRGKQLFTQIEQMKQLGQATIKHLLFDVYPAATVEETIDVGILANKGMKIYDAKKIRSNLPPARTVVDLHIEKLTDEWKQWSNAEILDFQLREFEKWYELAVAHHQPILIVVHGVGSGRLRDEIHEILKYRNDVKSFVNQYHPSFGYGSTEIQFK
jgi:hypothetical protein